MATGLLWDRGAPGFWHLEWLPCWEKFHQPAEHLQSASSGEEGFACSVRSSLA